MARKIRVVCIDEIAALGDRYADIITAAEAVYAYDPAAEKDGNVELWLLGVNVKHRRPAQSSIDHEERVLMAHSVLSQSMAGRIRLTTAEALGHHGFYVVADTAEIKPGFPEWYQDVYVQFDNDMYQNYEPYIAWRMIHRGSDVVMTSPHDVQVSETTSRGTTTVGLTLASLLQYIAPDYDNYEED